MSSSSDQNTEVSDSKIATEPSPPGMNSITNTVGMHPSTNDTLTPPDSSNVRRGSCDRPGCTAEHKNNRDLAVAARNRAQDLEIADTQQKDTILHEYQKTISTLIEKYGPHLNQSSSISLVARFATLSALNQLDPDRRNFLIYLLYKANLITYHSISNQPSVSLESANLTNLCLIDGSEKQTLIHISMEGAIMIKANFHDINITGAIFNRATLNNADFSKTTNSWSCDNMNCFGSANPSLYFDHVDLTYTSFYGAVYENATFESSKMKHSDLELFVCISCVFISVDMFRADLRNTDIESSSFSFAILNEANLRGAKFSNNVDFHGADMRYVSASHTHFAQCQFAYTLLKNATFDYTTIQDSTFMAADLLGISIQHSVFIRVNFTNVNLREENWQNVRCERCIFNDADFTFTDVSNATFIDSDFRNSTISEDQLRQAASLKGSILPNGTIIN